MNKSEQIDYLLYLLIKEEPRFKDIKIPVDYEERCIHQMDLIQEPVCFLYLIPFVADSRCYSNITSL